MRLFALGVSALVLAVNGCGGGSAEHSACRPAVSGGTEAERSVVSSVMCGIGAGPIERVAIRPSPPHEPAGSVSLTFIAKVPTQSLPEKNSAWPAAQFAADRAGWEAAIAAGAIRDRARTAQLPHFVAYNLLFQVGHTAPTLQSQGRIALPGWGDPEGQSSFPPTTLGHGVPSFDAVQQRLARIASETHTKATLGWSTPLGGAPYLVIVAPNPRQLLGGPITRYLDALEFKAARFDGVLIEVVDARHRPVWESETAVRVGSAGCSVYSNEAGMSHGMFPSFNSAGDRACAASGNAFV
jgi:hypothetical protein